MLQSYSLQTILSLLLSCLPLLTAFLIIGRRAYIQESQACLMAICLLSFFKDSFQSLLFLSPAASSLSENIFLLLNFSLILVACKPIIKQKSFKVFIPSLILATGAVFVTYMLLTGVHHQQTGIQFSACILVLTASLLSLFQLMKKQQIHILKAPLFWTAAGFFFYHFQYLLIQVIGRTFFSNDPDFLYYSWILMFITKVVTYSFFMVASFSGIRPLHEIRNPAFS